MIDETAGTLTEFPARLLRDDDRLVNTVKQRWDLLPVLLKSLGWAVGSSFVFGASLGVFSGSLAQVVASALKMPFLLVGAGLLCLPTLYVLQLLRSPEPMTVVQTAVVQMRALAATAVTWASLSLPVFFLVGTMSYYTLARILALVVGAAGGVVGFKRLVSSTRRLTSTPASDRWEILYMAVFGLVGAQLAWILRPFVGSPNLEFQLFRNLQGNIFEAMVRMVTGG